MKNRDRRGDPVDRISETIRIHLFHCLVRVPRTGVAEVPVTVPVVVGLCGIPDIRAVVAGVPDSVPVSITLVRVRHPLTVIRHVRLPVGVRVRYLEPPDLTPFCEVGDPGIEMIAETGKTVDPGVQRAVKSVRVAAGKPASIMGNPYLPTGHVVACADKKQGGSRLEGMDLQVARIAESAKCHGRPLHAIRRAPNFRTEYTVSQIVSRACIKKAPELSQCVNILIFNLTEPVLRHLFPYRSIG